jgi:hypothetical protein
MLVNYDAKSLMGLPHVDSDLLVPVPFFYIYFHVGARQPIFVENETFVQLLID